MIARPTLPALRKGGRAALARALSWIEIAADPPAVAALLDAAVAEARGYRVGLTGPPGVGKSTLANALVRRWRANGQTVAVLAVDPSSRHTGGALLGDRARMSIDPEDRDLFMRSMAARDRLGGLSNQAIGAAALMAALYDRVLVESVGIGQSEADISLVSDSVVLCVQPNSGDSLQFMKAGIMELPDIIVIGKADLGLPAQRARADVEAALALFSGLPDAWLRRVIAVSATAGDGLAELDSALDQHREYLASAGRGRARRENQQLAWVAEGLRTQFGEAGLAAVTPALTSGAEAPFSLAARLAVRLQRHIDRLA
jgi:LAO/AO transport system kinase